MYELFLRNLHQIVQSFVDLHLPDMNKQSWKWCFGLTCNDEDDINISFSDVTMME